MNEQKEIEFVSIGYPELTCENGCYDQCGEYGDCSPQCQGE